MSARKSEVKKSDGTVEAEAVRVFDANGQTPQRDQAIRVELVISAPKMEVVKLRITGTSPLVQHRFGEKARKIMMETQEQGSVAKKGKNREPKDFRQNFEEARHKAVDGWDGIHAGGIRRAMVDACRLTGFAMTRMKLAVFVVADGYAADGTPLVKIAKGKPHMVVHPVRNSSGVADLRARPMWDAGWEADVTIEYDADQLTSTDVANLLARVGRQCGLAEGRANSKESTGCGWGSFSVSTAD